MFDAAYAGSLLQYTDGQGHKNGTIYNEPRAEGDQYFVDYRNPAAAAYFVDSIVNATVALTGDAAVLASAPLVSLAGASALVLRSTGVVSTVADGALLMSALQGASLSSPGPLSLAALGDTASLYGQVSLGLGRAGDALLNAGSTALVSGGAATMHAWTEDQLRFSVVYRARCFASEAERADFAAALAAREGLMDLEVDILQPLMREAVRRRAAPSLAALQALPRLAVGLKLIDIFVRYPAPPNAWLPFHYCALPKLFPGSRALARAADWLCPLR